MKINNISSYISTTVVTLTLAIGAGLYLTLNPRIVHVFGNVMIDGDNAIGFPGWLIIPMGIAKLCGAIAFWAPIPKWLREWAYAGAFYNLSFATGAHLYNPINPNDGDYLGALIPLLFVIVSRYTLYIKERI